jgi:hypothetical protein
LGEQQRRKDIMGFTLWCFFKGQYLILNRRKKRVKTKILGIVTLLLLLTVSGCGGPSASEMGEMFLFTSIGTVIFSIPIIMLLAWLGGLGLVRNLIVWAQFAGLVVVSIAFYFTYKGYNNSENIRLIILASIISIPSLFIITSLEVLCLPIRIYKYLPVMVITPYYVMSYLLVITNSDELLVIFPTLLPIFLWYVTIPFLLWVIIYLIIKKVKSTKKDKSEEKIS